MKTTIIYWLAGLLDGEGCFDVREKGAPRLSVGMTDQDVIERVATQFGTKMTTTLPIRRTRGPAYKRMYHARVSGQNAIGWMMTLYALLGFRRQAKVRTIIKAWKASTYRARSRWHNGKAHCHAGREHVARGLCSACYQHRRKVVLSAD